MPFIPRKPDDHQTVLVISQTFVPDPASVGQHMADVAFELARRGHRVRVYASGRGYEDASVVYPSHETLGGADIRRFPFSSFGKKSMAIRVLGTAVFMLQAFFAALFTPNVAGIFFSTSPPLIGVPICLVGALRRIPVVYWAMDLNPDQLIALGKLKPTDWISRFLERANRFILNRATLIIPLDRFMADRLAERGVSRAKMFLLPPWPHESHLRNDSPAGENPFRIRHGLNGKFVVMYSGNHSPSNPLTTILDAAVRLRDHAQIVFLFVGGGSGKREVETYIRDHQLTNVVSLPYQPIADLRYSLAAADLHIVALGTPMVGIIHPCKIYGAMAVGKPILFLGPSPSHIGDLLQAHAIGRHANHGDVAKVIEILKAFFAMPTAEREEMGLRGQAALRSSLSQNLLCGRLCDAVENAMMLRDAKPETTGTPELA